MIIVIGSVTVRDSDLNEALSLSKEHVDRSRQQPGCLMHSVHVDAEDGNRLVFLEQWESMEALERHFQVQQSIAFIDAIASLATVAPQMQLFDSDEIKRH